MSDIGKGELQQWRIVLVAPQVEKNVGAVARLAANFGIRDLVIVSPECDLEGGEAKAVACGPSKEILQGAKVTQNLEEALTGCVSAIGFTRRFGDLRKASFALSELASLPERFSDGAKFALVFGREDSGLTSAELNLCTHACEIPSSEFMPSLNLSHAVSVVTSRLFEAKMATPGIKTEKEQPILEDCVSLEEFEGMMGHWRDVMEGISMTADGNPERLLTHVRKIFQRAILTSRETRMLRGILSHFQVAVGAREQRQPKRKVEKPISPS
jgi:tRNA/rRNA methyltransferase